MKEFTIAQIDSIKHFAKLEMILLQVYFPKNQVSIWT